jgi:hypothetical protein
MPAIQRRTTARTTQATKPGTEPVTDSHIDHTPPAAQPVNPRRQRKNTPHSGRIQPIPARPLQPTPVRVQRFPPARILSLDSILPQALPLNPPNADPTLTPAAQTHPGIIMTAPGRRTTAPNSMPNAKLDAQSHHLNVASDI